jgi:hypothetical protein
MKKSRRTSAEETPNLTARLHARWGAALGEPDPALFVTRRKLVLDASRAAFLELDQKSEKL